MRFAERCNADEPRLCSVMSSGGIRSTPRTDFAIRLEQARASGLPLLDLTESDPARCGLAWDPEELGAILGERRPDTHGSTGSGLTEAREAVASYLAGRGASVSPDHVILTSSVSGAHRLALKGVCDPDDEVLVPSPGRPFLDPVAALESVRLGRYALVFEGEWRLDRRSIKRAVTPRTRAIVVGNPSDPTGATISRDDLTFVEDLCARRGLALIGDETFVDTAVAPCASVAQVTRCLAFHVSGLSGVCGLPHLRGEWLAVAGPDELVAPALSRLARSVDVDPSVSSPVQLALPALLARRERFLAALRARLAKNRAALATASLREAPWSLQWGGGGCRAVLQVNPVQDEEVLCLALLEDGVAAQPGHLDGLPREGYLVVSLLPESRTFEEALVRLDRRLRTPLLT